MEKNGHLVISLDFELLWGIFDKVNYLEKERYFENTRKVIPEILRLFSEYGISCTWATVGMLFHETWGEWEKNIPNSRPGYKRSTLSAYEYGGKLKNQKGTEKLVFAKELVQKINETPGQEIGTHTYSHYYCLENGQTLETFKLDLEKSIELAKKMGIEMKSLVFPRNQFNEAYLKICVEQGIESVRSNPADWYWRDTQKDSLPTKIFRTADAYIGKNNKAYKISSLKKEQGKPLSQPASRLLRPFSGNKIMNKIKLERIRSEMSSAAKNGAIYHLWWHPHNFGNHPGESVEELKLILAHFKKCQKEYDFLSTNMYGINNLVLWETAPTL